MSVIAVVLYHAGFHWMHGGFFGVEVFFVISGFIRDRQLARAQGAGATGAPTGATTTRRELPPTAARSKGGSPIDDEMADIEALLKRRGIE